MPGIPKFGENLKWTKASKVVTILTTSDTCIVIINTIDRAFSSRMYTNYRSRERLRPKIRPIAQLDTSAWAFNFAYWVIFSVFLLSADFFQNQLFQNIPSGIPSECQTVWTHVGPDLVLSCLQEL